MSNSIFQKLAFATTGAVVICATAHTNPAQAAQFVYDFTGANSTQNSFDFTVNGLTVTATGYSQINPFIPAQVRQTSNGLGIKSSLIDLQPGQVDGFGANESLLLDFSPKNVRLLSATFGKVGSNDEFRLFVDGNQLISADIPGGNFQDNGVGIFNFENLSGTTGSQFRFTVTDFNDGYTLKGAVFQRVPESASIAPLFAFAALSAGSALKLKQKVFAQKYLQES
jgi:hypothetical protein